MSKKGYMNMKKNKNKKIKAVEQLLPKAYRPITGWNYLLHAILYSIPVIGWIFMIAHACADKSRHVRRFATAYCFLTLIAVAGVVGAGLYLGWF